MSKDIIAKSTCPYCGVGCGVQVLGSEQDGKQCIEIVGDPTHPANQGRLCVKGSSLDVTQPDQASGLLPHINGETATWDDALDKAANGLLKTIEQYGPNSVAFYLSGQLLTEDYYVANKLMKGFIGSGNVDTNSRLCMSSAVSAYQRSLGEDVVPVDYKDLDEADLVVLVGSNAAWTHPVLYQRMQLAKERGTRFVVIDPRVTATTELADCHLAIQPGSDVALFNGALSYVNDRNALDSTFVTNHTTDFAQTIELANREAHKVSALTGLSQVSLDAFYELFVQHKKVVTFFSQGVNQAVNGTDKANSIINLHLALGAIGKAGCGPFSITGQPNAMGGREVGGLATQLAAHMPFDDVSKDKLSRFWQTNQLAQHPGYKAVDLFDKVHSGEIKAIWIMATNPVVSLPQSSRVAEALDRCPLVIVSDCVEQTDTSRYANVFFPAAGWGEKDGTVTNSERTISRQRQFVPLRSEVRPDWKIVSDVAKHMGFAEKFAYTHPSQIFAEHAALSGFENEGARLFDISMFATIDEHDYNALKPFQWPLLKPFTKGQFPTSTGRAAFIPLTHVAPTQKPTQAYPFTLNTGRTRDQWHTMTRTGASAKLIQHSPKPTVSIHPLDAQRKHISHDDLVELKGAKGSIRAFADINSECAQSQVFMPIHWNEQFASPCRVSELIESVTDPISGQPESKCGRIDLVKASSATWLRMKTHHRLSKLDTLPNLLFWMQVPIKNGWLLEACFEVEVSLAEVLEGLGLMSTHTYQDHAHSAQMSLGIIDEQLEWLAAMHIKREALLPLRELPERTKEACSKQKEQDVQVFDPLSVFSAAEDLSVDHSALVCTCFEVRSAALVAAIAGGCSTTKALGEKLGCGTNCGSCLPEIRALLREEFTDHLAVAN